jgi:hypothetical protein
MGKKFALRVTINAIDRPRTLFSVKDPPNGEMIISRKAPDTARPPGVNPTKLPGAEAILPRVREQRYSIHPSKESPDANLLKATTTYASGKTSHAHHLTKVVKSGQRYAPMFIQRCPRLDGENFSAARPGLFELSLGTYDPQHFTPFFGVFVAARDNEFTLPDQPQLMPINVLQHPFRTVRLIVLWSFLALPSHQSSMASHFMTSPETPERTEGLTAQECCAHFIRECWVMEEELRQFMYLDEIRGNPYEPVTFPIRRYFANGAVLTPAAAEYMEALKVKTLTVRMGPRPARSGS